MKVSVRRSRSERIQTRFVVACFADLQLTEKHYKDIEIYLHSSTTCLTLILNELL